MQQNQQSGAPRRMRRTERMAGERMPASMPQQPVPTPHPSGAPAENAPLPYAHRAPAPLPNTAAAQPAPFVPQVAAAQYDAPDSRQHAAVPAHGAPAENAPLPYAHRAPAPLPNTAAAQPAPFVPQVAAAQYDAPDSRQPAAVPAHGAPAENAPLPYAHRAPAPLPNTAAAQPAPFVPQVAAAQYAAPDSRRRTRRVDAARAQAAPPAPAGEPRPVSRVRRSSEPPAMARPVNYAGTYPTPTPEAPPRPAAPRMLGENDVPPPLASGYSSQPPAPPSRSQRLLRPLSGITRSRKGLILLVTAAAVGVLAIVMLIVALTGAGDPAPTVTSVPGPTAAPTAALPQGVSVAESAGAPKAYTLTAEPSAGDAPLPMRLTLATNRAASAVRVMMAPATPLPAEVTSAPVGDGLTWLIDVTIPAAYGGEVRAYLRGEDGQWVDSGLSVDVDVR